MTIKDKNRIPEFKKRLKKAAASEIRGGVLGNEELAVIAGANEFGVKINVTDKMRNYLKSQGLFLKKDTNYITIPERPAIRGTFDDKKKIKDVYDAGADIFEIDTDLKKVLDNMGEKLVGKIQESIKSNWQPANHPFTTQQKKGKDKTLINTGRYVQGIRYKIV